MKRCRDSSDEFVDNCRVNEVEGEVGIPQQSEYVPLSFQNEFIRIVNGLDIDYTSSFEAIINFQHCGGDVNVINAVGESFLHKACRYGYHDLVLFLLQHGAFVNIVTVSNMGAQHIACTCGFTDIARILLTAKANVQVLDNEKLTPLFCAILYNYTDTVKLLLDHISANQVSMTHVMPAITFAASVGSLEVIPLLQEYDNTINTVYNGKTALHVSLEKQHLSMTTLLLKQKASVFIQNTNTGLYPIEQVIYTGNLPLISLLLAHNADPTILSKKSQSSLHLAAEIGSIRAFEQLASYILPQQYLQLYTHIDKIGQTILHILAKRANTVETMEQVLALLLQVYSPIS